MNSLSLTAAASLVALAVLFGAPAPALAQQPTEAQINAIRQACRADYQTYCASVPTGGSAANNQSNAVDDSKRIMGVVESASGTHRFYWLMCSSANGG
jgi:hypothetical protein